ncbi:MAG: DUF1080 domain-containing protein [Verrucomicrobiales bacterium]|nr:DUF1080 domain-containing protein [Verrucomicrobiales bacterium]
MNHSLSFLSLLSTLLILTSCSDSPSKEETDDDSSEGWISLFDGESLKGWKGYNGAAFDGIWIVEDGGTLHLAGQPEGSEYVNLITEAQFADFDFRFEWKVEAGTNSGVMFRLGEGPKQPYLTGPEYQILDNAGFRTKKGLPVGPAEQSASHYAIEPATSDETKSIGEWNLGRILVQGNKVEYWLNGVKTTAYEMHSPEWKEQVANSKFSKWKDYATLERGHIGLQDHGHRVWFRHLKIKEL